MTTKMVLDAVGLALVLLWFINIFMPDFIDARKRAKQARKNAQVARQNAEAQRVERLWRKP